MGEIEQAIRREVERRLAEEIKNYPIVVKVGGERIDLEKPIKRGQGGIEINLTQEDIEYHNNKLLEVTT